MKNKIINTLLITACLVIIVVLGYFLFVKPAQEEKKGQEIAITFAMDEFRQDYKYETIIGISAEHIQYAEDDFFENQGYGFFIVTIYGDESKATYLFIPENREIWNYDNQSN